MDFALKIDTPPAVEPVTLAETKLHLRVDDAREDELINSYIRAARISAEHYTNRAFLIQTWSLYLDRFPPNRVIELPKPPLESINSIKYYDSQGDEQTFSDDDYYVDEKPLLGRIVLKSDKSWPVVETGRPSAVRVQYIAGFGNSDQVDDTIKTAIKQLVSHWFDNREPVLTQGIATEMPFHVKFLLEISRVFNFGYGETDYGFAGR